MEFSEFTVYLLHPTDAEETWKWLKNHKYINEDNKLVISQDDELADIDTIARYLGSKLINQNKLYQHLYVEAEKAKGTRIIIAKNFHY